MTENEIKPIYSFVEETEDTSPLKRKIAKKMEITENFNLYDVLAYIAKMKKAAEDKYKEAEGIETMIEAYEKELREIEAQLGVQKMEELYQQEIAEENEAKQAKLESDLKTEILRQREEAAKTEENA